MGNGSCIRFSSPPELGETFGTLVDVDCVSRTN